MSMWADATLPAAANVASVMLDDREMSVSDIHPITFNRRLRRASSDDGQTARDQSYEIAGRRHVIKGGGGGRAGRVQVHRGSTEHPHTIRRSALAFVSGV